MKAINGGENPASSREKQRRSLLAKIHIAKKELGLSEDQYRSVLSGFDVDSCAYMTIAQLEDCVRFMKRLGWKPVRARKKTDTVGQAKALRDRAIRIASEIDNGEPRLRGLCRKICNVDQLGWCNDVRKLKSLVAAMENVRRRG